MNSPHTSQPKTVGICHYLVGSTDGVSLEIAKWARVLEALGYRVRLCAGELHGVEGFKIPELSLRHPAVQEIYQQAFTRLKEVSREDHLQASIDSLAQTIEHQLKRFLEEHSVDLLIVHNIWSLGAHLAAAEAFWRVIQRRGLPVLAHHHDFYWERPEIYRPTCPFVKKLLDELHPPASPLIRHVVINSLARRELAQRKGVHATVVPNVFDFDCPPPACDEFNADFRASLGLSERDIVVLQATRVVRRKGIELAIDVVAALQRRREELERRGRYDGQPFTPNDRIILLLTNSIDDAMYFRQLEEKSARMGVPLVVAHDRVAPRRGRQGSRKMYSFWDAYAFADLVTYPSLWEGFGNQLLEAIWARLPIVLFEYPVYRADIAPLGFSVISLGSSLAREPQGSQGLAELPSERIETAAEEALHVLIDGSARQAMVRRNFEVAKREYSMQALERRVRELLADLPTVGG